LIVLINMEIIDLVCSQMQTTHKKKVIAYHLHVNCSEDDFEKRYEGGYQLKSVRNIEILKVKFDDNRVVTLKGKEIEKIISERYGENVELQAHFPSMRHHPKEGTWNEISIRLIAKISDEVQLSEEDIRALIDIALLLNDKEWFHELVKKLPASV
jgi:hypothetical protein